MRGFQIGGGMIHHDEQRRFAMATPVALRRDFTGPQFRIAAKQTGMRPSAAGTR